MEDCDFRTLFQRLFFLVVVHRGKPRSGLTPDMVIFLFGRVKPTDQANNGTQMKYKENNRSFIAPST